MWKFETENSGFHFATFLFLGKENTFLLKLIKMDL